MVKKSRFFPNFIISAREWKVKAQTFKHPLFRPVRHNFLREILHRPLRGGAVYAIIRGVWAPGSGDNQIRNMTGASAARFQPRAWEKGKQVEILCDLVTVIGEWGAKRPKRRHWPQGREGRLPWRSMSQETCRPLCTGAARPKPRGIGCIVPGAAEKPRPQDRIALPPTGAGRFSYAGARPPDIRKEE